VLWSPSGHALPVLQPPLAPRKRRLASFLPISRSETGQTLGVSVFVFIALTGTLSLHEFYNGSIQ
jgi:hypothetical protein